LASDTTEAPRTSQTATTTGTVGRTRSEGGCDTTPELKRGVQCSQGVVLHGAAERVAACLRRSNPLVILVSAARMLKRVMNSDTSQAKPGCADYKHEGPAEIGNARQWPRMMAHKVGFLCFKTREPPLFEDGGRGRLASVGLRGAKQRSLCSSLRASLFDRVLHASSMKVSQGWLLGWGAPGVGVGKSKQVQLASPTDGCSPCPLPRSRAPGFKWRLSYLHGGGRMHFRRLWCVVV